MPKPEHTDAYIAGFPEHTRSKLEELRSIIRRNAPEAEELISYGMPAYKLGKVLVYFAGYAGHIGFYPTASGIVHFESRLGAYKHSKGAIQFPLDQNLPEQLIADIVRFRVQELKG